MTPLALAAVAADQSFPPSARLLRRREYERVLRAPQWRASNRCLRVAVRSNELGRPRLGIAAPKRAVRRAVDRSRAKRLIREGFRVEAATLPSVDIVVGVKRDAAWTGNPALFAALHELWERLRCASLDTS
nr:ribonuclease P protein component [Halorhodospira neutriphila]